MTADRPINWINPLISKRAKYIVQDTVIEKRWSIVAVHGLPYDGISKKKNEKTYDPIYMYIINSVEDVQN